MLFLTKMCAVPAAAVRFVSDAEDNLTNDYYDTETAVYVERLERDGMKAVYLLPPG